MSADLTIEEMEKIEILAKQNRITTTDVFTFLVRFGLKRFEQLAGNIDTAKERSLMLE